MEVFGGHRFAGFPNQQHDRVFEIFECPFISIHPIRFLSHGDEMGARGFDLLGKLFCCLDRDAFRIENAIGLEHGDDVKAFFQTGFHECFRWIP